MRFTFAVGVLASLLPAQADKDVSRELARALGKLSEQNSGNQGALKDTSANFHEQVQKRSLRTNSQATPAGHGDRHLSRGALRNKRGRHAPAKCDPNSFDADIGVLSCGEGRFCMESKQSNLGGICANSGNRLKNHLYRQNVEKVVECDPTMLTADTGILSCGQGMHCAESKDLSLGGFCMPNPSVGKQSGRQLSYHYGDDDYAYPGGDDLYGSVCDPKSPYYGVYSCNCVNWNTTSQEGTITCYPLKDQCLGHYFPGCNETCASVEVTYEKTPTSYTYTECYDFTSPYSQEQCYTFTYEHYGGYQCAYSFNGVECNSCMYSYSCTLVDCMNTELQSTFCLDNTYPKILEQCIDTCHICGDDSVANPFAVVQLPYGGGNYTCYQIDNFMRYYQGSDPTCSYVSALTASTCCTTPVCNICPDGLMYPNATMTIPYVESVKCSDLDLAGQYGFLGGQDSYTCSLAGDFAQVPCCGVAGPYTPCDLCPGADVVSFAGYVELPGVGNYSCAFLDLFGQNGHLNEQECSGVTYLASEACCACNVCGVEGQGVSNPEGVVEIPTIGNVTCFELHIASLFGELNDTECMYVQPLVQETCECAGS